MINLDQVNKIYFIGIGGIGMSAAAGLAKSMGFEVSGSDSKEIYSPAKEVLDGYKINYTAGYGEENAKKFQADLYVLSAGEGMGNPEIKYVVDNGLPHVSFAELLYYLNKDKIRIVVTGTHGKSTTSGLLGYLLKDLDNGSFFTGAVLNNLNSNFHEGDGHYIVFEGDEYKSEFDDPTPKFHYYKPDILVLTNLEYDHPDIFENLEALEQEFEQLISNLPEDGLIVYNADDPNLSRLVHKSEVSSISFGIENEADFKVEKIEYGEYTDFEITNKFSKDILGKTLGLTENYKIQLPGKINVYNSLAAISTLRALGFQPDQLALSLLSFTGLKRRFEIVGIKNGITLIDDYAHHPTAVKETLDAARLKFSKAKIWAVFEPHTFSRTKATLKDLAKSFNSADEVLISEIYPAREKVQDATITGQEVVEAIQSKNPVRLIKNKEQALDILKKEAKAGDVLVVMAVGAFNKLAYELKELL